MPMIDSDKLKLTLKAWQDTETAIITATQAADAAFLRGDHAQAEVFSQQARDAVRDRYEKADYVAKLVEALIWQVEQGENPSSDAERYRWLKSRTCIEDRDGGYTGFYRLPKVDQRNGTGAKNNQFYYSDLDAAIDAAIERGQ